MRRITGAILLTLIIIATALFDVSVGESIVVMQLLPLCGIAMLYGFSGVALGYAYLALIYLPLLTLHMVNPPPSWQWLVIIGVPLLVAWGSLTRERSFSLMRMHQRLLDSMRDGVVLTDEQLVIRLVNPAACTLLALPAEKEARPPYLEQIGLLNQWAECVCHLQTVTQEYGIGMRTLQITVAPVFERSDLMGLVTTVVDFTAERQLITLREDFLALISHELRNPLTSIHGFADLLLANGTTGELAGHLRVIKRNCGRLLRLVQDLLHLHSLEAGRFQLQPMQVDLTVLLQQVIEEMQPMARESKVALTFASCHEQVLGWYDPDRLSQVFSNLLENALKHSPCDEQVQVSLSVADGLALVGVLDRGAGIPAEELDTIFDKYYQAVNGRKLRNGSGLGLAISRQLVELHGGKIWASTEEELGTSFWVSLPVMYAALPSSDLPVGGTEGDDAVPACAGASDDA